MLARLLRNRECGLVQRWSVNGSPTHDLPPRIVVGGDQASSERSTRRSANPSWAHGQLTRTEDKFLPQTDIGSRCAGLAIDARWHPSGELREGHRSVGFHIENRVMKFERRVVDRHFRKGGPTHSVAALAKRYPGATGRTQPDRYLDQRIVLIGG